MTNFSEEQMQMGIDRLDNPDDERRLRAGTLQQGPVVTAWWINQGLI